MAKITIYTDGSSKGNPGPGGFGAIIVSDAGVQELGGEAQTTNNRMELRAAIESLQSLSEGVEVEVHSDSEYVINGITKWVAGWQRNGWRTKNKKPVLNQDLWEALVQEIEKRNVSWTKVLGHSGHKWNGRCDEIATTFADGKNLVLYNGPEENYR